MKKFFVSDIRWANESDLKLPFWRIWNKKNPLPRHFWQRIWEYPYLCSKIPSSSELLDIGGTYPQILFPNFPKAISVDIRDLNALDHPLHKGKWPKDRLVISDATTIPKPDNSFDYVCSISAIEEMPDTLAVLKEILRLARHRVVITVDVSDKLGLSHTHLRELENFLNVRIPSLPPDPLTSVSQVLGKFGQLKKPEYKHIRVLGFTLDACDSPRSVGILIPHWESLPFLKFCLDSIQNHRNEKLIEKIYVIDDASKDGSFEKAQELYKANRDIEFHQVHRPNKTQEADVGLILDEGLRFVNEQYVAMIDADVFPVSKDWLMFPIWLIKKFSCSSVGLDTGLSTAYLPRVSHQRWWQPREGYSPCGGLYENEWFTCTNNLYRVMPTVLAKIVSENIGFTRGNHLYRKYAYKKGKIMRIYTYYRDLLAKWLKRDYLYGGCDNGVAANHFIDINRMGPKFNIPLTSYIGLTPRDGAFGQNVSGLIFHFALSTRALSTERREISSAGERFAFWAEKLKNAQSWDRTLFEEMIAASTRFQPGGYDGSVPISWYEREFNFIKKFLGDYERQL